MSIPSRGSLVWLDFDPQAGNEQMGHRPAIVLSDFNFNSITGFAVVCPITKQVKDYPFEVPLPDGLPFTGVVLTNQFKSLDVKTRKLKIVGHVMEESEFMFTILHNVRSILA
ncbi:type II toxin-antitoxin system PemK/MazF family toxin [Paenibacillus yanchengensis]|uniref:Type II toxin-antitoxin system PemK/MazF family toxin n=1 Tax=Paenibacillus yanchengensis TaxID=2035833 RepID=A0ABW4YI57_9BACL